MTMVRSQPAVQDVYLLALHEPYFSPEHPVEINATIVHGRTLLHPSVPQPDGGLMYRCLVEFPGRTIGCLVPISTLTFELDGGRLWPEVAEWEDVVDAIVRLARTKECDAMALGLLEVEVVALAGGPTTTNHIHHPDGSRSMVNGDCRQRCLDELAHQIQSIAAQGPFWPGYHLVTPPTHPPTMPYQPYRS